MNLKNCRIIYEVEALGPLLLLGTFGNVLRNALWTHYIDHEGAQASLVCGSSSVHSGDFIAGATCH